MKTINLACQYCKKIFEKELRYYKRSEKKGLLHFCSMSCASKHKMINHPNLMNNITPGKETDEVSPYRKYMGSIRSRCKIKNLERTIDLMDLKKLWEKQQGLCAISGIPMILPPSTSSHVNTNHPHLASIDRIDPNKGYEINNIQWICLIAQYCKNIYTTEEVIFFCNAVVEKQGLWKINS